MTKKAEDTIPSDTAALAVNRFWDGYEAACKRFAYTADGTAYVGRGGDTLSAVLHQADQQRKAELAGLEDEPVTPAATNEDKTIDTMTVAEVSDWLAGVDDLDELDEAEQEEAEGKNRKGVLEAIAARRAALEEQGEGGQ